MFNVLIAEDELHLRNLITKNLQMQGYNVTACENGEDALELFQNKHFDILITDIMMPKMDGDTLLAKIKSIKKDMPVIMLTALSSITDKKKSFSGGADDYMTKPIDFDELGLRISALLRRYNLVSTQNISHKGVCLDFSSNTLSIDSSQVELTKKEFLLLYMLMSQPNRIFSRTQILDEIWGYDTESFERTVDVHINKIREKLQCSSLEVITVRGLGYKAVLK